MQALFEELTPQSNYWQFRKGWAEQAAKNLRWQGEPLANATEVEALAREDWRCRDDACTLWVQDLNGDGQAEVLLIQARLHDFAIYAQQLSGQWQEEGSMLSPVDGQQLLERLEAGEPISRVPPAIQALQIGEIRLEPKLAR